MKMGANKALQVTAHKECAEPELHVGATIIIEPINPKNPVVGDTATSRPAPSLLENRWNSQKTEMNSPNKALQVTAHKAPNLNADVGARGQRQWIMGTYEIA